MMMMMNVEEIANKQQKLFPVTISKQKFGFNYFKGHT